MSLYEHVPHPHVAHRKKHGAPTVAGAVGKASLNMAWPHGGTRKFGSMPAFYLFVVYGALGAVFVKYQATLLYWSNWIQLWSLPLLMVGGIVLGMAHDRAAQQQFDDTEAILHGQGEQANHLSAQDEKILAILDRLDATTTVAADVKAARSSAEAAFAGVQALAALATAPPGGSAGTSGTKPGRSAL